MSKQILIVDDDPLMRRSLTFHLEKAGYATYNVDNAEDALAHARRERPALVLLDIGLPGMDGLQAVRHFRDDLGVPVIFLTARRRELDEVLGLELGADDYITKPFDADVLLARIRSLLRRVELPISAASPARPPLPERLEVGDIQINLTGHTVTVRGKLVELAPRLFDLLVTLAQEPARVFTLDELLNRIWGSDYEGEPQVVYVHMRWLRERIEEDPQKPQHLITVRGVGYKLVPQLTPDVPES